MIIIFLYNKLNGNDYLVMRSDFTDIYSFIKNTVFNLHDHKSILFDFSIGMGTNNSLSLAVDIFSPFNILYFIFYKANLDLVTLFVISLKVATMSATFNYFSQKVLKNCSFSGVIISVLYSLNAYVIIYGTIQISWLDSLVILPILMVGLHECIENNRRVTLILSYFYLFVTQFYMGYIVGLFSFIVFILYTIFIYRFKTDKKVKEYFSIFFNWALGVVISIMLSAFVWVPTLFFLAANRVPDSTEMIPFVTSLLQIFNSLFWGLNYGIGGHYAYIYCGIFVLVLSVLYFVDGRNTVKHKLFFSCLLVILFLSMNSYRINMIWHGFDQPDDFWYRYSFLVCFVLCTISSRYLVDINIEKPSILVKTALGLSFFYLLINHTKDLWGLGNETHILNTNFGFTVNFVLICLWSLIIYALYYKKIKNVFILFISIIIVIFELVSPTHRQIQFKIDAKAYNEWDSFMKNTLDSIRPKDNEFYRIIMHKNDNQDHYTTDTLYDYYGISDFGDQEKYSIRKFCSNVGFATSPRATFETGYNPVSEMILGVKYGINAPDTNNPSDENFEAGYDINDNCLNLGYMVDGGIILYEYPGRNVFENMNGLVNSLSGVENDCFIKVDESDISYESEGLNFTPINSGGYLLRRTDQVGYLNVTVKNVENDVYIQFENDDSGLYDIDYYIEECGNSTYRPIQRVSTSYSAKMIENDDCHIITVYSDDETSPVDYSCNSINIYELDETALKEQFDILSQNQLNVTSVSGGDIKGNLHVEGKNRLLFTTLPYDPGWKAFVNGSEVETIRVIEGAFLGIYLPDEGDYEIEFKYEVPGLKIGLAVSLLGIGAFLSVIFEKKIKKDTEKNKKKESNSQEG